jgi:hypothetical protein
MMLLALVGCSAAASPSSRATPSESEPPPSGKTPVPGATLSPLLPPGTLDLGELGWQTVLAELDSSTSEVTGHTLAIATLDSGQPAWLEHLVETPWTFTLFADQQPVVDGPTAGKVLYVSDDGVHSEVRLVDIHGTASTLLGATDDVVYTARLSPDGASAYLVLLDRVDGRDRGVFRLEDGGDGSPQFVMGPPAVDRAQAPGGIRLVAVTRFVRTLRISADGHQLARLACGEPFGECVFDILDIAQSTSTHYNNPGQLGELVAIGGARLLGGWQCLPVAGCVTDGLSLARGMPEQFPGHPPALDERGDLVLLQFPPPTEEAREFSVTNLDGTDTRRVFVSDGTVRPIDQEGVDFAGIRLELPLGWVAVNVDRPMSDGGFQLIPAAVRLSDGGWLKLTLPQINAIGGGHD